MSASARRAAFRRGSRAARRPRRALAAILASIIVVGAIAGAVLQAIILADAFRDDAFTTPATTVASSDDSAAEPSATAIPDETTPTPTAVETATETAAPPPAFRGSAPIAAELAAEGSATWDGSTLDIDGPRLDAAARALPVAESSATGYRREAFGQAGADEDRNGCDTRNDILARDLDEVAYRPGSDCVVVTGTLRDPYTGRDIPFVRGQGTSTTVQIDHILPLAIAWTGGANLWTLEQRQAFANDPSNLQAVDGPSNLSKSDFGPAEWAPEDASYTCAYAARFAMVATRYAIAVTSADREALVAVAGAC